MLGIIVALLLLFAAHIKPIIVLSIALLIILRRIFNALGQQIDPDESIVRSWIASLSHTAYLWADTFFIQLNEFKEKTQNWPWQTLSLLIALFLWLISGIFQVDMNEKAMILRFGSVNRIVGPGLHWYIPIVEDFAAINIMSINSINKSNKLITNDEGIIDVSLVVFYKVDANKVFEYKFKAKSPESIIDSITDSIMREVIASKKAEECLTTERNNIAEEIKQKLDKKLREYNLGVIIQSVQVGKINPPHKVLEANRSVIDAQSLYTAKKNEAEAYANQVIPESKGDAAEIIAKGNIEANMITANTKGALARFNLLAKLWKQNPTIVRKMVLSTTVAESLSKSKIVMSSSNWNNKIIFNQRNAQ